MAANPAPLEPQMSDRYEMLVRVSRTVKGRHDLNDLVDSLPRALRVIVRSSATSVQLYDETSGKVSKVFHDMEDQSPSDAAPPLGFWDRSASSWAYEHQQCVAIPSIAKAGHFSDLVQYFVDRGIRSLCYLPLRTEHRRIGVLTFASKDSDTYTREEVRFLGIVADQIALAIDSALNLEAARRERDRLKLLLELNNRIVSKLELRALCRSISSSIRKLMRCDFVAITLPDEGARRLHLYVVDFPDGPEGITDSVTIPFEGTPSGMAFSSGKPETFNFSEISRFGTGVNPGLAAGLKSGCFLPLLKEGRVLGTLNICRFEDQPFTLSDVEFLEQLANQVAIAVSNAISFREVTDLKTQLAEEKLYLEGEIRSELHFDAIIGKSAVLRRMLADVETVAPTDATVLICGETGTGKELIARAIHNLSARRSNPFVKLNCAAIPTGLLESELFGHERGAFTGAIAQRIGRFELASRGTVFLDEIGDISLELQPKLLRVLQEKEFERLGSTRTLQTDARLIAATNRDLGAMVDQKQFRSDLFYRLNVFPVNVPSLRERPEDIPLLVRHFAQQFARRMNKRIDTIPANAMQTLVEYRWPGNIRELQNVIERAVIISTGSVLKVQTSDLRNRRSAAGSPTEAAKPSKHGGIRSSLEITERAYILDALEQCNWIVAGPSGAANRLGMKRTSLQLRIKKLGISRGRD